MTVKRTSSILTTAILSLLLISACSTPKSSMKKNNPQSFKAALAQMFQESDVFSSYFTGFVLYDPQSNRVIYAQNERKYFVPASNTKLYTFYTALKYLPDKIPALKYIRHGDSLIFWGTGDPSFLRKRRDDGAVYHFLKNSSKSLYFSDSNFQDERFGSSWGWNWYTISWAKERTPMPIYGNAAHFYAEGIPTDRFVNGTAKIRVEPSFFSGYLAINQQKDSHKPLFTRGELDNNYLYTPQADTASFSEAIPYHYTPQLLVKMLSDTLHKPVEYIQRKMPANAGTLYSVPADSVYKHMLLPSDNFIAEQLLLTVAAQLGHPLNTHWVIHKMKQTYLQGIPDPPKWYDGSGLSHLDMFTPRDMIWILKHIRAEFSSCQQLFELLPAGGKTGTLDYWLDARDGGPPYVHAKTGTLGHARNLSGFIETESGQILLFSFMNNNYTTSVSTINHAMENVLWFIHENY